MTWLGRDSLGRIVDIRPDNDTLTTSQSGGDEVLNAGAGSTPDWWVPDEENQTVDVYGGLHLHSQDDPEGEDAVTVTIDGRTSAGAIVSLTPEVTNQILLDLSAPDGQSVNVVKVQIGGDERLALDSGGTLRVQPDGDTPMLTVTTSEVEIANNTLYVDATTVAFFGENGAGQSAAIPDATDAGSTMARLNDLLAYLRSLGLVAS